jgi:hypothetical protein
MATTKTTIMSRRCELPEKTCSRVLFLLTKPMLDNLPQVDVADCHGFLVDRIPDPVVFIRCGCISSILSCPKSLTYLGAGGIPPYIYGDIGGSDRWIWFVLANLLSLAAICPFVGALSDLIGRRYVAITGACFLILGMIISSTAHTMNIFIGRSLFPMV